MPGGFTWQTRRSGPKLAPVVGAILNAQTPRMGHAEVLALLELQCMVFVSFEAR